MLQDNIRITGDKITGELKKVEGYDEFSSDPSEQNGHYLVLKISSEESAKITTKMTGAGSSGKTSTVNDGYCVYLVKDEKAQKITITASKNGKSNTKTYDLSGLTLSEV